MMRQVIISDNGDYNSLDTFFNERGYRSIFVVCGKSAFKNQVGEYLKKRNNQVENDIMYFSDFTPNPEYKQVEDGIKLYKKNKYDLIVAVGGGSSIDVAKAIKYYLAMENYNFYKVPLLAIPTTAGSGAEATMYAVIYHNGEKKSVGNEHTIPNYVFFDANALIGLPLYHKKACMLDALCHSIESIWSAKATAESVSYAQEAISVIIDNYLEYINEEEIVYQEMIKASYLAGKAICITQTTAAHAMAYKLTKKYSIAHGHAVALCMNQIFSYMIERVKNKKEEDYVQRAFKNINFAFGVDTICDSLKIYQKILSKVEFKEPNIKGEDIDELVSAVNADRLRNMPIEMPQADVRILYEKMSKDGEHESF